jgi:ankyrin repeat protein
LEYSDDNIIIDDGDGFGSLPPPLIPPSSSSPVVVVVVVSSQYYGSNTTERQEEKKGCPPRSEDDDIHNREEEGGEDGDEGSVNNGEDAEAAMVAIVDANNASNDASNEIENGTPSSNDDDIMREIVLSTTAEVSATSSSDCNARNAKGESALSISSSNFLLGGMKLLIDNGADVNIRDACMRTPLHLACENNNAEEEEGGEEESSAAVHHRHHDCVVHLLMNGANVDARDVRGRTPSHVAARVGCARCIRLLLDCHAGGGGTGGGCRDVGDANGDTPLHIAATRMGHLSCMAALSPGIVRCRGRGGDDDDDDDDGISHSSVEPIASPSLLFDDHDDERDVVVVVVDDHLAGGAGGSFYQSPRGGASSYRSSPRGGTGFLAGSLTGRRPRQDNSDTSYARDESPYDNHLGEGTPRFRNDSGYFTAKRGRSAWVKSKYYRDDERHEDNVRGTSSIDSDYASLSVAAYGEYDGSEDDPVNGGGANPCVAAEDDDDVAVSTWIYGCILRIALYSIHLLTTWSNRVCKTSSIKETLLRTSLAWSTKITDRRFGMPV